jgi:hypothetical protein
MSKILRLAVILTLMVSMLFPTSLLKKTQALENAKLSLGEETLVDWMLDKENNTLLAITNTGNLHYISMDTLAITGTIQVGNNPTDLERQDNKMYIALPDSSMVKVVDFQQKTILEDITTLNKPYRIAVNNEKLFYADDESEYIYDYNLSNKSEVEVTILGETYSTFYKTEMNLEDSTGTLFIAESGLSGSDLYAISTTDYSLKSIGTFDDSYGFSYPYRSLTTEGTDVFYAGHKINKDNLEEIFGVYVEDYDNEQNTIREEAAILAVDGNYVYSTTSVFNRNTFEKVGALPEGTNKILSDGNRRFIYNENDHTISINNDTFSAPIKNTNFANNKLFLDQQIDKWVMDESNNRIYAISENSNELLYIDSTTMAVVGRQIVGSIPTDIELTNGKIYIALSGSTKIATVGTTPGGPVNYINTLQNPFEIEVNGNNVYYTIEDQWANIYHIDLTTKVERKLVPAPNTNIYNYYEPAIYFDKDKNLLYVAESGSSGSTLYVLDSDGNILQKSDYDDSYGFPYPGRNLLVNDSSIYYAGHQLQKSDVTVESGKYFDNEGEEVVSLNGDYLFSTNQIYNKNTKLPIYTFPKDIVIDSASIDSAGNVYVSVPGSKAIYKFHSLEELQNRTVENFTAGFDASGKFQFAWDLRTGDGYNVYAKKQDEDTYSLLNDSELVNTTYTATDTQLKSWYGSTVSFDVRSLFGAAESEASNTVDYTFEIPVPTNIQYSFEDVPENLKEQYGDQFFNVTWDKVPLMDGYSLYYYTSENPVKKKVSIPDPTDTEVSFRNFYDYWVGKTVYFEVASVVNGKESALSETHSYTFTPPEQEEPVEDPADIPTDNDVNQPEEQTGTNDNSETGTGNEDNKNVESGTIVDPDEDTTTSRETESKKIVVKTKKEGSTIIISVENFEGLGDGAEIVVDLSGEEGDKSEVLLTSEQIKLLLKKGISVTIERITTTVSIPSSVFAGKENETKVTVTQLAYVEGALSDVFDFTIWQGESTISQFDEPVTLSFKVDPEKVTNPENVKVYYWNEEEEAWELIGGTYKDGVVTAETNHFSIYTVFEKAPEKLASETVTASKKETASPANSKSNKSEKSYLLWVSLIAATVIAGVALVYILRRNKKTA